MKVSALILCLAALGLTAASAAVVPAGGAPDGGAPDGGVSDGGVSDGHSPLGPAVRLGWFKVTSMGPSVTGLAVEAAQGALEELRIEWLGASDLRAQLKHHDREAGRLSEAGRHLQMGRKLHLGLKLRQAQEAYSKAIAVLEAGQVRFYAPEILAEPLLQLGVAQFQNSERDLAHKTFMRVAAMSAKLQLDAGYYSPLVRKAFAKAQADLGEREPGVPRPLALAGICEALSLAGLVVVSTERMGDRPLLRLSLYSHAKKNFVAVETAVVQQEAAAETGLELAERLKPSLAGMGGIAIEVPHEEPPLVATTDGGVPAADEDSGPSWAATHWWIWPVAAAALAAAVTVPIVLTREDVVDVRVRY
jgi:hypothetical protein